MSSIYSAQALMKYIEIDKSINGIYYQENKILQTCFHGGDSKELWWF